MDTEAAQGFPKITAAKVPPKRCPLVPPATGKLIIWAAKINAVVNPITGAYRNPTFSRVRPRQTAKNPVLVRLVTVATTGEINPSGMCIN